MAMSVQGMIVLIGQEQNSKTKSQVMSLTFYLKTYIILF
jgi:hypothetical protein